MSLSSPLRGPLVFALGAALGCAFTLFVTGNGPRDANAAVTAPALEAPREPVGAAAPIGNGGGLPHAVGTVVVDEGGSTYTCTNAKVEVLDPSSSSPRLVLDADCPNGKRLNVVARPHRLPGNAPVQVVRFADIGSGEEWAGSDARLDIGKLGDVGNEVSGQLDVTMAPRLNEDPVHVVAYFRATRSPDRSSP